ncbi:hypothetical protein OH805_00585 [Streptomyces sp. NBC_00879]|uniref:hypothetical protein n=1 Tax=Streptomyces sp. NBC_00879 TaxID=2975855 RepID=UPI003863AF4E|nr:hypothetical protein OH805_00585 [Streptomyces sp. NBC_00879]
MRGGWVRLGEQWLRRPAAERDTQTQPTLRTTLPGARGAYVASNDSYLVPRSPQARRISATPRAN